MALPKAHGLTSQELGESAASDAEPIRKHALPEDFYEVLKLLSEALRQANLWIRNRRLVIDTQEELILPAVRLFPDQLQLFNVGVDVPTFGALRNRPLLR